MDTQTFSIAILDMYDDEANVGMAAIKDIISSFEEFSYEVFDVRNKHEFPGFDFDIYIFSGGPGDPLKWENDWTPKFYNFIDILWKYNLSNPHPKPAFFICHSFQMMCHHFGLGALTKRKSTSFGLYPIHLTKAGRQDPIFGKLSDPFYGADSRNYQFIRPAFDRFEAMGASILAMEKKRPHILLERAVMAVRFSNAWVGAQFHPEADPKGMLHLMLKTPKGKIIRELKGDEKFDQIIEDLRDPTTLERTYQTLLPAFLKECITHTKTVEAIS